MRRDATAKGLAPTEGKKQQPPNDFTFGWRKENGWESESPEEDEVEGSGEEAFPFYGQSTFGITEELLHKITGKIFR